MFQTTRLFQVFVTWLNGKPGHVHTLGGPETTFHEIAIHIGGRKNPKNPRPSLFSCPFLPPPPTLLVTSGKRYLHCHAQSPDITTFTSFYRVSLLHLYIWHIHYTYTNLQKQNFLSPCDFLVISILTGRYHTLCSNTH